MPTYYYGGGSPSKGSEVLNKIIGSDIMVPVDVQGQYIYLRVLSAPLDKAQPKHVPDQTYSYTDVEASAVAYSPPTGYYAVIFRVELDADSNADYAYIKIDDVIASKKVGAGFSGAVLDNTTFPWGAPCKTSLKLSAKAQATLTTNVTIRAWLWEVPVTLV